MTVTRWRGSARCCRGIVAAALALSAFSARPARARDTVADIELQGTRAVDVDTVLEGLATTSGAAFDTALLARDLKRIERYYRSLGFYEAKVSAARILRTAPDEVRIEIVVQEGLPVVTRAISIEGLASLPLDVGVAALAAIKLREREAFSDTALTESRDAIATTLAERGYAFVRVEKRALVDVAQHAATVHFSVVPGKPARYGLIRIVGLSEIPADRVYATLHLAQGQPYARADVVEAEHALVQLGVFASVQIHEDLSQPERGVVPLNLVVQEAPLRVIRIGGGTRLDALRLSTHLRTSWEDRNFLGGMRHFSVQGQPGITFYPTSFQSLESPTRLLPEHHAGAALRQPAFVEDRTLGFVSTEYNVYPLLYPRYDSSSNPNDERILGYNEGKISVGLERLFFDHRLWARLDYTFQANFPFSYQGQLPAGLADIEVSVPELQLRLSFTDSAIEPHRGVELSNSLQVGYIFGSTTDLRLKPELRTYVPLAKSWTWATRLTAGFLLFRDYGAALDTGEVNAASTRNQQELSFRAFYSGGPNSNRGYPLYGVGPQGPVAFLIPEGKEQECFANAEDTACRRPLGGLTLGELSTEIRFPIVDALGGVAFADMSDVTRSSAELSRSLVTHLSVGLGLRYRTLVGPLRLDAGWRVPGFQGEDASGKPTRGTGESSLFGPITLHLAIGEAF